MLPMQKITFLRDCQRHFLTKDFRYDPPETVLRMSVIKILFPGLRGGNRSKDQDS